MKVKKMKRANDVFLRKSYKHAFYLFYMEDRIKNLLYFAKRLDKNSYKRLKKINNPAELEESVEYFIYSNLMNSFYKLESEILAAEKKMADVFIPKSRLLLVPPKIKTVKTGLYRNEFDNLMGLFKKIKGEVRNV